MCIAWIDLKTTVNNKCALYRYFKRRLEKHQYLMHNLKNVDLLSLYFSFCKNYVCPSTSPSSNGKNAHLSWNHFTCVHVNPFLMKFISMEWGNSYSLFSSSILTHKPFIFNTMIDAFSKGCFPPQALYTSLFYKS